MHVHITMFWTIVLGIIGSIIGGAVTHLLFRPTNPRYHPAGLVFFTLGAILVLFICYKLNIHFPQVLDSDRTVTFWGCLKRWHIAINSSNLDPARVGSHL